jgi:hypothetical protein
MVIVPVREVEELAATEKLTTPLPVPLAPAVTLINPALLTAVHAQPAAVVTFTVPLPPADAKFWLVGLIEYEQPPPPDAA